MTVGRDYRYVFPLASPSPSTFLITFFRATWIRDSSFTLYALIRLGFTEEANSMFFLGESPYIILFTQYLIGFLEFIFERLRHKNADGSINIMYTIHG